MMALLNDDASNLFICIQTSHENDIDWRFVFTRVLEIEKNNFLSKTDHSFLSNAKTMNDKDTSNFFFSYIFHTQVN